MYSFFVLSCRYFLDRLFLLRLPSIEGLLPYYLFLENERSLYRAEIEMVAAAV
jgi:hypothetical protein